MQTTNTPRRLLAVAALATAMLATTASAALGASFSSATGQVDGAGTLSITNTGATHTITCNVVVDTTIFAGGNTLIGNSAGKVINGTCTPLAGSPITHFHITSFLHPSILAGATSVTTGSTGQGSSAFGVFTPQVRVPFVAAAGGQPAKLAFNNTRLGATPSNGDLYATGDVSLNDGAGGNVSINP